MGRLMTSSLAAGAVLIAITALAPGGCTVRKVVDDDEEVVGAGSGGETGTGGEGGTSLPTYPIPEPVGPWNLCPDTTTEFSAEATVVPAHEGADHFWLGWEDGENFRTVDATATFPDAGSWRRIFLEVDVACPEDGRCDWWDRGATISLVDGPREGGGDNNENDDVDEVIIELTRHMTPYRRGMCFVADVTDLAPRLRGEKTIRSFIDTWVGPGHSNGSGWRVTTRFIMHPGRPDPAVVPRRVIPLWNPNAEDRLVPAGDPAQPVADALPPREIAIPADTTRASLLLHVTGHGQGNLGNCAEFCDMTHRITIGGTPVEFIPWRDDCADNPIDDQLGTWRFDRAGWCPGAYVAPTRIDVSDHVQPGETVSFTYDILDEAGDPYVNTCRPNAGDANNQCAGCTNFGPNNCDYNNNGHTAPYHRIGVQLLTY
ncbi:MAG: peptide-N-glycosidase F-related protein [Myxococcota bacterium]